MSVKHAADVPLEKIEAGDRTSFQLLIGADEAPHFAMRRFVLQPGGSMPRHTNTVEHEQFVLRGAARITIGDEYFHVEENDVVFIPAGEPHSYVVEGSEPFEFLCMVPNLPDEISLTD